jgi:Ku protein
VEGQRVVRLVTIPVKLYAATGQHEVSFRQVRAADGVRVRYKRVAETDGEEVPYADIRKDYELPSGQMMIIDEQDLANLPLPSKRVVDVVEFVPLAEIDLYFQQVLLPRAGETGPQAVRAASGCSQTRRDGRRRQSGDFQS